MKIERVTLKDFRQYFGEQRVEFSQDRERNVTVFHGVNGAGKTSFFVALNWCLYGEGAENIGQIISKEAVRRAQVGEIVTTKVTVTFIHEGQRYIASRQMRGQKKKDGSIQAIPDIEFVLMRSQNGISKKIGNPIGLMNTIMPSNVRTYFFFDGEKIDNFARQEAAHEVKHAIYQVLNLETLSRGKYHLTTIARELRSELGSIVSGELKELVAQGEEADRQETELLERQEQLHEEIALAERHIAEINQQLRELESVQALQREYDLYTEQIHTRQREFSDLLNRIKGAASEGYLSMATDVISKAVALLDEKRQRGEIPSNIRQQFVEDLINRGICICGRPFDEHDEAYQHLSDLLTTAVPSNLEDDVLNTNGSLRALLETGRQQQLRLTGLMRDKVNLEEQLERLYAQRDDVERQMRGADQVEVSDLARKRDEYRADIDEYKAEQVRVEMQIENIRATINDLKQKIAQAEKTEYRERLLSQKLALAEDAAEAIRRAHDRFAESKRQQIEQESRRIFHSLAWKGEHFNDVRLSEEYHLEVIDRYGFPARPELSAGERQVLSLSFIMAMAQAAEREAPLVMDTPFGRLSSEHREAIAKNLPELASQLVVFVTDEELHGQALAYLRQRIGAEYVLSFSPNTSCTTVEEAQS